MAKEPKANKPTFTEVDVQEYRKAFEQEFQTAEKDRKAPISDIEELRQPAYNALEYTLKHSLNETLRTNTAKWVLDKLLDDSVRKEDKVMDFLKGLPAPDPTSVET